MGKLLSMDLRRRAPPEDVGGPPSFEAFLEAIGDPAHPEHTELLDWHGGPFDPENIDEDIIRIQFDRLGDYTDDDIGDVIWSLNTTPRKCLCFRTPIEAFALNLGVALEE